MVTDDDDNDEVVVVNYGITTPDYNHNVGADYDIENDDDDDLYALYALIMPTFKCICALVIYRLCSISFSYHWLPPLYRGSANLMVRLLVVIIGQYRYKYNLVQ